MSAVVVVDETLRLRIIEQVAQIAAHRPAFKGNIAADVRPERYQEVINFVGENIDLDATDDFEIAVVVALTKAKRACGFWFIPRNMHPRPLTVYPQAKNT